MRVPTEYEKPYTKSRCLQENETSSPQQRVMHMRGISERKPHFTSGKTDEVVDFFTVYFQFVGSSGTHDG